MGKPGAPQWSIDFDLWATEALDRGDVDALFDFRTKAPGMPFAHPTVEHFAPLFVTLGAVARPRMHLPARRGYAYGLEALVRGALTWRHHHGADHEREGGATMIGIVTMQAARPWVFISSSGTAADRIPLPLLAAGR
jgi:hypothetical protein